MEFYQGKNDFTDNVFDDTKWSAPACETPQELMERIDQLDLIGRTVKDIEVLSYGFNWGSAQFDIYVDGVLETMDPILRERIPDPDDMLPHGVLLDRFSEIDAPVLFLLDEGDVLAVDFHWGSAVRIDIGSIPFDIRPNGHRNFHANRLFREIIGKKIADIEIGTTKARPEFGALGQDHYIASLTLVFAEEEAYSREWSNEVRKLRFEAWIDFGHVTMLDEYDKKVKIATEEVPWIVEGFGDLESDIEWERQEKEKDARDNDTAGQPAD